LAAAAASRIIWLAGRGPARHEIVVRRIAMAAIRVQVRKDGSIALPRNVLEALGADVGSYLAVTVEEDRAVLCKTTFDPFAEAQKKPDPDAFEKILRRQREGLDQAERDFMQRLKEPPPEVRPEDRPEFWD
jgi:bifunctional DNA-binding transcriptional regulator/antitoxin component of YhaV-PrlF toxin-antitoxin module